MNKIQINRAPVMALWAAVVAERLGFDADEALSLGKAVAGLNAQAKGLRLGIFKPHERDAAEVRRRRRGSDFLVELLGRPVPARLTAGGVRALAGGKAVRSAGVRQYLGSKFGDDLARVREALEKLARAYEPAELATADYSLYERFRPDIPAGTKGWGAKGDLDLRLIGQMARRK